MHIVSVGARFYLCKYIVLSFTLNAILRHLAKHLLVAIMGGSSSSNNERPAEIDDEEPDDDEEAVWHDLYISCPVPDCPNA